jgi:hypothetical protein
MPLAVLKGDPYLDPEPVVELTRFSGHGLPSDRLHLNQIVHGYGVHLRACLHGCRSALGWWPCRLASRWSSSS